MPLGIAKESTDVSNNVSVEEIGKSVESVGQELEALSQLIAAGNPSKEKFLGVADDLQEKMGRLNLEINMMRRKYTRK